MSTATVAILYRRRAELFYSTEGVVSYRGFVAAVQRVRRQVRRLTAPQYLEVLRGDRNPFVRQYLDGIVDERSADPRNCFRRSLAEHSRR
jgi:hypothetical protein